MSNTKKESMYLLTYTGKRFEYPEFWDSEVDPDQIELEDIAHSLSMQCRFGGHCNKFYSVAQHSLLVYDIVRTSDMAPRKSDLMWAILHDAAEAYISDIVTPLKTRFKAIKVIEDRILKAIAIKFNIVFDLYGDKPYPTCVQNADSAAFYIEANSLMKYNFQGNDDLSDIMDRVNVASRLESALPSVTKQIFMNTFLQVERS